MSVLRPPPYTEVGWHFQKLLAAAHGHGASNLGSRIIVIEKSVPGTVHASLTKSLPAGQLGLFASAFDR